MYGETRGNTAQVGYRLASLRCRLNSGVKRMETTETSRPTIPVLQPGERIVGSAYLTQDGEIVFTSHRDSIAVVLVGPKAGSSGPWAVRLRPPTYVRARAAGA